MERWEPPATPRARGGRGRRSGQLGWPAVLEVAGGRLLAAFVFLVGGLSRTPSFWLPLAGSVLVLALIVGATVAGRGTASGRLVWLADALVLGILTPIVLFSTFAATGTGPVRPDESSVYLQTAVVAGLLLAGLALYAGWRSAANPVLAALSLLPGALTLPVLAEAHRDLRDTTVSNFLALTWVIAALVSVAACRLGGRAGALLPVITFAGFTLVIWLADPSFITIGNRGVPVRSAEPLLILGAGALLLLPLAWSAGGRARSRRRSRPRRSRR